MKKILLTLSLFIFSALGASATTMIGTAVSQFSTEKPTSSFAVKLEEDLTVDSIKNYPAGTIFYGKVTKVVHGKRGKRQGYFVFEPTHYVNSKGDYLLENKNINIKVSFYKPFNKEDAKKLAQTGITTAAGFITHVPLLSEGVSMAKGIIKPEENTNRVVSGFKQVYKDSPLVYVEKGEELYVYYGQKVKLTINEE